MIIKGMIPVTLKLESENSMTSVCILYGVDAHLKRAYWMLGIVQTIQDATNHSITQKTFSFGSDSCSIKQAKNKVRICICLLFGVPEKRNIKGPVYLGFIKLQEEWKN